LQEEDHHKLDMINDYTYEILLAIFYHDYVYPIESNSTILSPDSKSYFELMGRTSNELLSYYHVLAIIRHLKLDTVMVNTIMLNYLFKVTETHTIGDFDCYEVLKLMSDLDLSILASNIIEYDIYRNKIYKEHQNIDAKIMLNNRLRFLTDNLMNKELIYYTEYFKKYEERARNNIQQECTNISNALKDLDKPDTFVSADAKMTETEKSE
jgi:hypothetical protein